MERKEFQAWLPAVTADAIRAVLAPVLDKDALGVSHEVLNQSAGGRTCGELHIQTVENRHSRLKDFPGARRGIASRHLDS